MLLELRVKNYKSIKNWQSFSLLAESGVKELEKHIVKVEDFNVLTTSLIYGRNASGKSNLLNALKTLQFMVLESGDFKVDAIIPLYDPYKLDKNFQNSPTEFYLDFLSKDNIRYIYEIGFSKYDVEYERLKFYPKSQPATLFERNKDEKIKYGEYLTGRKKDIEDKLYKNQLFLSKIGTNKLEALVTVYKYFSKGLFVYSFHDSKYDDLLTHLYTNRIANDKVPFFKENMNLLMKEADTGIESIEITEEDIDVNLLPEEMSDQEKKDLVDRFKHKIRTVHKTFDGDKEVGYTKFKLEEESTGTIKLLGIGGLILEALDDGQTLVIDELDKSLHPKLTKVLINIFHSKKTNPKNAQLIFATHDVSLLDNTLFRRDQVWFAEKEFEGCSHYYSIADIAGVRATAPYEKYYMSGRLGAIPVINENELNFQF
ncbi:AAA family ATPase [Psychroserpens algicola]|uniref:ATP-binding protein n=1 Tax=Psychroserpens algicola TaxID=1719034 RepID=A0ABT0HD37_9FLAO|nr:ATP-binding protein [Psychroserpens algicola]MCK8482285.1 ATP-binding protein [Psychroserpens algicola]